MQFIQPGDSLLVTCVTVGTDCAGDPLVAHSLDALKRKTNRSKAGRNAFSLTNGKLAALAMAASSQHCSSLCLL